MYNAYYEQAEIEYKDQNYEMAIYNLTEAYKLDPSGIMILYNIARAYSKIAEGTPDSALEAKRNKLELARQYYGDFLQRATQTTAAAQRLSNETFRNTQIKAANQLTATAEQLSRLPQPPLRPPIEPPKPQPLHRRWWFWPAIGGTVLLVGVGVGVGLGLRKQPVEPVFPSGAMVLQPTW